MMSYFSQQSKQPTPPLLSPHSATTNNGVIDNLDANFFFENGQDGMNAEADDDLAFLDGIFENEMETAKAMEAAKMNIITFTGSPPPTSPGYSSAESLSPFASSSGVSVSGTTSSSLMANSKPASPPPSMPATANPISGENPWNIEIKTAFGGKYWRNDKKALNCFPFCVEFGLDFRTSKMQGLNHTRKPCIAPVEGSFLAPKDLQLRNVVLLGRFLMVSPQLCASEGRKLFHVGDIVQQSDVDGEINDCGVVGRISLVRDGSSNANITDAKMSKPTVCDFEFVAKDWFFNVTLPKTRRKQNDSTSIPLYSFEALILLISSPGQYVLISRCISAPFQIASLRTLLREIAAKEGRSGDTASNSDASVPANGKATKPKAQPKKKEAASGGSQATSSAASATGSIGASSSSASSSFAASSLPTNLTKRGHESGRNAEDDDSTPLYFALDDQDIPHDLFSEQEILDLDKILDDVAPQDRKKVRTLFVQEAQKQKQKGQSTSLRNLVDNGNIIIPTKTQTVTNGNHPLAPEISKPPPTAPRPQSIASSSSPAVAASAASSMAAVAATTSPIATSSLSTPLTAMVAGTSASSAAASGAGASAKATQADIDSEIVYNFDLQKQTYVPPPEPYSAPSPTSKSPSAPPSSSLAKTPNAPPPTHMMIPIDSIPVAEIAQPLTAHQQTVSAPSSAAQERVSFNTNQPANRPQPYTLEDAYVFWLALGIFGGHHYYLGRYGYGILYTLTMAGFGIGWLIDGIYMSSHVKRANSGTVEMIYPEFLFFFAPPFGLLGGHHYAINRTGFGLFYTFTMGGLGVGWLADMFRLGWLWKDFRSSRSINAPPVGVTYSLAQHVYDARIMHMPLGLFGAHHFFLGNYGMGFLYLCTIGMLGIGWIVDFCRMTRLVRESRIKYGLERPTLN